MTEINLPIGSAWVIHDQRTFNAHSILVEGSRECLRNGFTIERTAFDNGIVTVRCRSVRSPESATLIMSGLLFATPPSYQGLAPLKEHDEIMLWLTIGGLNG